MALFQLRNNHLPSPAAASQRDGRQQLTTALENTTAAEEQRETVVRRIIACHKVGLLVLLVSMLAWSHPASAQQYPNYMVTSGCNLPGYWSTFEEAGQACVDAVNQAENLGVSLGSCAPSGYPIPVQIENNHTSSKCTYLWHNGQVFGTQVMLSASVSGGLHVSTDTKPLADCGCNKLGHPINPVDGNVSYTETDIPAQIGSPQSEFGRVYNSADPGITDLGVGWRHSFSRKIVSNTYTTPFQPYFGSYPRDSSIYDTPQDACVSGWGQISSTSAQWPNSTASYANGVCSLSQGGSVVATISVLLAFPPAPVVGTAVSYDVIRDNGQDVYFTVQAGSIVAPSGSSLQLTLTATGYQLIDDDDNVETYNSSGALISVTSRAGVSETLSYDSSNRLSTVTDSFGHQITLGYNSQSQLASVQDPSGVSVQYAYDAQGRLATVTNLDGTTRTYGYNFPLFPLQLTQVTDESGGVFLTWAYNEQGKGTNTQEAGGANSINLTYNSDGSVTTTDALGATRKFSFNVIGNQSRIVSISGSQCPTCQEMAATTYDAAGWVSSRTDYNGNVTCYASDPVRGLELVRVEGLVPGSSCPANLAGYTPAPGTTQRKVSTTWSTTYRLPTQVVEATKTTSFGYDTTGNLLTKTVTDTTVTPIETSVIE